MAWPAEAIMGAVFGGIATITAILAIVLQVVYYPARGSRSKRFSCLIVVFLTGNSPELSIE